MPVHVSRKRNGVWYARGSVKVGDKTTVVPEYSTGCTTRADADAAASKRDRDERDALIGGAAHQAGKLTLADCLVAYIDRAGGVKPYDLARVAEFNDMLGARLLSEAADAWRTWLAQRGATQKPSSIARWRSTLQAAINYGALLHSAMPPKLPSVKGAGGEPKLVYLSDKDRARLLASYNPYARRPILVMAYQGTRTQETLQLDWRYVDLDRREIRIVSTEAKSRRQRTLPMHAKVHAMLLELWTARGKPSYGKVFLSAKGEPYADTRGRGERQQGGNPLSRAHETACAKAGVDGFRVHDWRHLWATLMVQAGVDLRTLMDLGGWSTMRMVAVYATVTADRAAAAIGKLK